MTSPKAFTFQAEKGWSRRSLWQNWKPCCSIHPEKLRSVNRFVKHSLQVVKYNGKEPLENAFSMASAFFSRFSGFPNQKGRHRLRHYPVWAEAVCDQVPFAPYVFYPDKPVHIQVSVNHVNFSDPGYVHEAVVSWVEDILDNNFTVCVTQAGRNKRRNGEAFATVDWLAYQGAPDGGVSGEMDMPTWWTGTTCRTASLPLVGSTFILLLCRFSFLITFILSS